VTALGTAAAVAGGGDATAVGAVCTGATAENARKLATRDGTHAAAPRSRAKPEDDFATLRNTLVRSMAVWSEKRRPEGLS